MITVKLFQLFYCEFDCYLLLIIILIKLAGQKSYM